MIMIAYCTNEAMHRNNIKPDVMSLQVWSSLKLQPRRTSM